MTSMASKPAATPSISASASPVSTVSESDQDDSLQTVRFTDVKSLFDAINSNTGDCLVVTRMVLPPHPLRSSIPNIYQTSHLSVLPKSSVSERNGVARSVSAATIEVLLLLRIPRLTRYRIMLAAHWCWGSTSYFFEARALGRQTLF